MANPREEIYCRYATHHVTIVFFERGEKIVVILNKKRIRGRKTDCFYPRVKSTGFMMCDSIQLVFLRSHDAKHKLLSNYFFLLLLHANPTD